MGEIAFVALDPSDPQHAELARTWWLDRFFDSYYRLRPVNATFTGMHRFDHLLPDWSPDGLEQLAREMRTLRRDARPFISSTLDARPANLDVVLADAFLEIQLAELEGTHFIRGNPSLWVGEAVFAIIALMTRDFAPLEDRVASAAARLRRIPAFLAGARDSLGAVPEPWRERALRECEGARRLLNGGIARWLAEGVRASLASDTEDAAVEAFGAFEEFARRLRGVPSAERVACGVEMFDLLLARGHLCSTPRGELLTQARAALDEEAARLYTMTEGAWDQVQHALADRHPSVDEYLLAFERTWKACRDLSVERDLVTWPDTPIRFAPIPPWTRDAAPFLYYLFYRSPAPLDSIDVHEAAVTPIDASMPADVQERLLRGMNDSVIKLNHVVHHGALGHHVQNAFAARSPSRVGQVAAVDCASRIAFFSGGTMAEGWACYATELMEEAGFLTELERFSEQHTRVRMLARAVVDMSLHEGTMSLDQAAAFYAERAGMPPEAARNEAVKNSMFPGAAVMYWLGTQGIRDLRSAREAAEGAAFSLRAFHDSLLSLGSIPIPLIARIMQGTS
jgi:hypothetical protein